MALSVDLTPAQEARVVTAFGSVSAAESWLREQLVARVVAEHQSAMQRAALADQRSAADALRKEFG